MPQGLAAPLELAQWAIARTWGELPPTERVLEAVRRLQHVSHVLSIVAPVGGAMQETADLEAAPHELREGGLDQTPFVVPLLRPWVGKKHVHGVE